MYFKQKRTIFTLSDKPVKLENQFSYLGSNILSTESDVNIHQAMAWNTLYRLLIIWKSILFDRVYRGFFQAVIVSMLLQERITWALAKCIEK